MMSCVDELMQLDCQDMSACGNDCTMENGDAVSEDDGLVCACCGLRWEQATLLVALTYFPRFHAK